MKYMERDLTIWFNRGDDEISVMHRKAYEKSLKCNHAVKVHRGSYYYKGYELSDCGSREYPWNYRKPSETGVKSAKTKSLAMAYIDSEQAWSQEETA